MFLFILMIILLVILAIIFNKPINVDNEKKYNLYNYTSKNYIMTKTELDFFRNLKKITDELELVIFPQVNLERIIQTKNNNNTDRNRIKSRSIDYTIVNNKNCRIIACIELDDYTHNREKIKKNDEFKNMLFKQVNIPLYRIKVSNNYNLEEIKNNLKINKENNL